MVLVDEVEAALEAVRHMKVYAHDVMFVTKDMLGTMDPSLIAALDAVEPWGWDKTLGFQLAKANARLAALVPSAQQLEAIRTMSSRRYAAENLLSAMVEIDRRLIGKSVYCDTVEEVAALLMANGQSVIKAPWSCSGRGIRYVGSSLDDHQQGWLRNIMKQQGGVTVEPLYNKVYDFGMEFMPRQVLKALSLPCAIAGFRSSTPPTVLTVEAFSPQRRISVRCCHSMSTCSSLTR